MQVLDAMEGETKEWQQARTQFLTKETRVQRQEMATVEHRRLHKEQSLQRARELAAESKRIRTLLNAKERGTLPPKPKTTCAAMTAPKDKASTARQDTTLVLTGGP